MKVLQFSGGADSLATLFMLRAQWPDMTVMWCNTGSAYPETLGLMDRIKNLVPNFLEVRSHKNEWRHSHGIAVDVVPARYTPFGRLIHTLEFPETYTSHLECCAANIWKPLEQACFNLGAKVIIRGQRQSDASKAPILSGHVDRFGIRYEFPIQDWTRDQVITYCKEVCYDYLPDYYKRGEDSSRDCWDCIAYLGHNQVRINHLPMDMKPVVRHMLRRYDKILRTELIPLEEITNVE